MNYVIYTDGSCRRTKDGGIGVVWLRDGKKVMEYSKSFIGVTNNQMELMAIFCALKSIKNKIETLEIVSDSEYAIGSITKDYWTPKKNISLIERIKKQLKQTQELVDNPIKFRHTFGHSNDKWNNYADKLAQNASLYEQKRNSEFI